MAAVVAGPFRPHSTTEQRTTGVEAAVGVANYPAMAPTLGIGGPDLAGGEHDGVAREDSTPQEATIERLVEPACEPDIWPDSPGAAATERGGIFSQTADSGVLCGVWGIREELNYCRGKY